MTLGLLPSAWWGQSPHHPVMGAGCPHRTLSVTDISEHHLHLLAAPRGLFGTHSSGHIPQHGDSKSPECPLPALPPSCWTRLGPVGAESWEDRGGVQHPEHPQPRDGGRNTNCSFPAQPGSAEPHMTLLHVGITGREWDSRATASSSGIPLLRGWETAGGKAGGESLGHPSSHPRPKPTQSSAWQSKATSLGLVLVCNSQGKRQQGSSLWQQWGPMVQTQLLCCPPGSIQQDGSSGAAP